MKEFAVSLCQRDCHIMVIIRASQARDAGSIPVGRLQASSKNGCLFYPAMPADSLTIIPHLPPLSAMAENIKGLDLTEGPIARTLIVFAQVDALSEE